MGKGVKNQGEVFKKSRARALHYFGRQTFKQDRNRRGLLVLLASDILLPDDTPIRVEYKNQPVQGKVISVEGFDVVLELESYIGDEIAEAYLFSEPWELLESLCKRLEEVRMVDKRKKRLLRLIRPSDETKHPAGNASNAIKEIYERSKHNPVSFIWGPPGTGKTYALARVIARHYLAGRKVLAMAHSNAAVDVLMTAVAAYVKNKQKWKRGEIVRYGFNTNAQADEHGDLFTSSLVEHVYPDLKTKARMEKEKGITQAESAKQTDRGGGEHAR